MGEDEQIKDYTKFWKEHFDHNAQKYNSMLKQVDMTINGQDVPEDQVKLRVDSVIRNLNLNQSDEIIDLCCGNGLLTKRISYFVKKIYAFDLSDKLIEVAMKESSAPNILYFVKDVTDIDFLSFKSVTKVNFYSCIQYINIEKFNKLLTDLAKMEKVTMYVSNVPDKHKIWDYYDTPEKKDFYLQSIKKNQPHIGTWYEKDELKELAKINGFNIEFLEIEKERNTSYYRFDFLVYK